jgi:hypothetical protein
VAPYRNELLARPLALWNHLDINFSEEIHAAASSTDVPLLPANGALVASNSGSAIVSA